MSKNISDPIHAFLFGISGIFRFLLSTLVIPLLLVCVLSWGLTRAPSVSSSFKQFTSEFVCDFTKSEVEVYSSSLRLEPLPVEAILTSIQNYARIPPQVIERNDSVLPMIMAPSERYGRRFSLPPPV